MLFGLILSKKTKMERVKSKARKIRSTAAKKYGCSERDFPWEACLEIAAAGKLISWEEISELEYEIERMLEVTKNLDDLFHIFSGRISKSKIIMSLDKMKSWGVLSVSGRRVTILEKL